MAIRIFLTRMCLQVHVNVRMTTVEYLILFKKMRLFDWISVFRRLEAEHSALTALLNHSYLVMPPIAYFLDSSVM